MALPILDGNQTAATLSTIITGGAHIPAHTVVSLGSQAISDITSGVSGSVVSISNFPSTQTVAGTVTANLSNVVTTDTYFAEQAIKVVGPNGGGIALAGFDSSGNQAIIYEEGGIPVYPRDNKGLNAPFPIAGTVTASLQEPSIGVNTFISESGGNAPAYAVGIGYNTANNTEFLAVNDTGNNFPVAVNNSVTIGSLPAISGTVTVGASSVTFNAYVGQRGDGSWQPLSLQTGSNYLNANVQNSVTIGSLPSGALTTRFGSVTTANTAQITSAVTNTSRKYLLAQNISAGTVTIGIGFSPTTTQGIQLPAGGGLTFDAFCPTGAVFWLGAVTGAAYTILEG